jgi:cobalt/nickel transport system permease protein
MTVVLAVQALLFQDGGISAFGGNTVDMAMGGVFAGYAVAALVTRQWRDARATVVGATLGAFAATLVAAVLTAVWLGLSGLYPLAGILPVMLVTHVAIGVLEAALTGAVLVTIVRWRPDLIRGAAVEGRIASPSAVVLGVLGIALAMAAFVSPFASSLPDGLERAAERLGFAGRAGAVLAAPFPDYAMPFVPSAGIAAALAGLVGTLAAAAIAWGIGRGLRAPHHAAHD